jgi:hypothetical protein
VSRAKALSNRVGAVHQRALKARIDVSPQRGQRKMQRAAMRRINPDRILCAGVEPDKGAGLGAMAVQDIRFQSPDQTLEARPHQCVGRKRLAANSYAVNAKFETRRDFRQRLVGAFAAGETVGDDADVMAALGLAVGEVEDMTKNPADGRTRCVQDAERLAFDCRHDQNQRSPTSTVSPGLREVPGGTT